MKLKIFSLLAIVALAITSCKDDDSTPVVTIDRTEVIENYANMVVANYQDALTDAQALKTAIDVFVADPTEIKFNAVKSSWKNSRESYGPSEAFRFAEGPIDDESNANAPEGWLNAWPLEELYIDYVDGNSTSGIINDTSITLSKNNLSNLNNGAGQGGSDPEKNVAIGYHAIEFLLWGQDLTSPTSQMAGQRPYSDFVDGGTANNQDRRRQYLTICADLIIDHLQYLINEWNNTYNATFTGFSETEALTKMFGSIAEMASSELAVERMEVAVLNQDQEDEHSCFSDNTHRDIRLNLDGIANVYRGSYGSVSGPSLEDLIAEENATLGAQISGLLADAISKMNATATPFDYAIVNSTESTKVLAAITALKDFGDKLAEGAAELGITVNI